MNFKTTLVLLILLVAIGGYLFFTRESGETKPKKHEEHKLLEIASTSDVTKIVVAPASGKPTVLEKQGKEWKLVEPMATAADVTEVNTLLSNLVDLKSTAQLDAKEAASAKTGLDSPQFTVTLTAGGKEQKLQLGDRMAVGNTAYAKVGGKDGVEVIPADVLDKLDRPAKTYREAKVVRIAALDVRQLTIQKKDETLKLEKEGVDWKIVEPIKAAADSSAATDLVNNLAAMKAKSFVDDPADASEAMRGPAQMTVTISSVPSATQPASTKPAATAPAGSTQTLTFGPYDDVLKENVYVKVSEPAMVAKLAASSMEALNKKPIDLRDKRVVDVKPEEVSRVTIATEPAAASTQPGATKPAVTEVVIERRKEGAVGVPFVPGSPATQPSTKPVDKLTLEDKLPKKSAWMLASAENSEADDNDVNGLLTALHPLRVDKYLEKNPATQPAKSYVLSVHTEAAGGAGAADHKIRFVDRGAEQPYVGEYNGLTFEVSRFTLSRYLEADYKKKAGGAAPPPAGGGAGMPGGLGFPQGQ